MDIDEWLQKDIERMQREQKNFDSITKALLIGQIAMCLLVGVAFISFVVVMLVEINAT